jgi:hypothetical protein
MFLYETYCSEISKRTISNFKYPLNLKWRLYLSAGKCFLTRTSRTFTRLQDEQIKDYYMSMACGENKRDQGHRWGFNLDYMIIISTPRPISSG